MISSRTSIGTFRFASHHSDYDSYLLCSMTANTILGIVYGVNIETDVGQDYLRLLERGMRIMASIGSAGTYLGTV